MFRFGTLIGVIAVLAMMENVSGRCWERAAVSQAEIGMPFSPKGVAVFEATVDVNAFRAGSDVGYFARGQSPAEPESFWHHSVRAKNFRVNCSTRAGTLSLSSLMESMTSTLAQLMTL